MNTFDSWYDDEAGPGELNFDNSLTERGEDETFEDYCNRLVDGTDDDGVLSDLSELAQEGVTLG